MFGIKIQDSTRPAGGGAWLSFDLRDILHSIGEPALESEWRGRGLYYLLMRDGVCGEFDEARRDFSGKEFVEFAATVHQTIDGEFTAKKPGSNKAWLVIEAVDSSWFEVWSTKPQVLDRLKLKFSEVTSLPPR